MSYVLLTLVPVAIEIRSLSYIIIIVGSYIYIVIRSFSDILQSMKWVTSAKTSRSCPLITFFSPLA